MPVALEKLLRSLERHTKTDMVYLFSGGFWLFLEQASAALAALLLAIAFGHFASQDTFGNYKYALSLASLLGAFSLSGIGTAITQATAKGFDGSLKQGFRLNLTWSWGIVAIALCGAAYYFFTGNNFVGFSLIIIALAAPLLNSFALFDPYLVGKRLFKLNTLYNACANAAPALCVAAAVLLFPHRAIYFVATYFVIATAAKGVAYMKSLRRASNDNTDPAMFRYGFHLSLMGVIGMIADKMDSILVFAILGPVQLAVYAFAIAMPEQVKGLIKMIGPLSMPGFAERSLAEIKKTIWKRLGFLLFGITAVVIVYIVLAPFVFQFLFPVYMSSVPYSQLYILSLLFSSVIPLMVMLQSHKKTKELYVVTNVGPISLLILLPILTSLYGVLGAIISQIIQRGITALLVLILFITAKE